MIPVLLFTLIFYYHISSLCQQFQILKKGNVDVSMFFLRQLFSYPKANFLMRRQRHSPDVNHCTLSNLTRRSLGAS